MFGLGEVYVHYLRINERFQAFYEPLLQVYKRIPESMGILNESPNPPKE